MSSMNFTTKQILKISQAHLLNSELFEMTISQLSYDSRKIDHPSSSLFFAFRGTKSDGHDFIDSAYFKGVRNFVISIPIEINEYPNANFFKVSDVLKTIQEIALAHRVNFKHQLLAITGSNGKTIVKEWISQLFGPEVFKSPMSYNSQLGVAISLSKISNQTNIAIIEAGISQKGEMSRLHEMIQPNFCLFTNLGAAHDAGFANRIEKLEEKLILANGSEKVYCSSLQQEVIDFIQTKFSKEQIVSWGKSEHDDLKILNRTTHTHSTLIKLEKENQTYEFVLPFKDDISIENALHAINFAIDQNINIDQLKSNTLKLSPIRLRLEILEGINQCKLINDAYVFDLYSLQNALNFQDAHREDKSLSLVLSNIQSNNLPSDQLSSQICQQINQSNISKLIIIGEHHLSFEKYLKESITLIEIEDVVALKGLKFQNECILIKGSKSSILEACLEHLELRAYTSRLEINLTAVSENYNYYKSKLKSRTGIMAVLKAGAYGSGSLAIAKLLADKGVKYMLVAHIDEGIELRTNAIQTPIVVLNPDPYSLHKLFEFGLETEVYSLEILDKLDMLSKQLQASINLHINLDTGMHRLGLQDEEMSALINTLSQNDRLHVETVFTHLSGSEHADHDDFSNQQFQRFEEMLAEIKTKLNIKPKAHILNSAGILRFEDKQYDLVRLGLGLYGLDSSTTHQDHLKIAHSLKAHVLQIKSIKSGESLGYNQSFIASQDMSIAILNIGYADGLPRNLSNGLWQVSINGHLAPIVGKISMDLTIVDVSDVPDVRIGETVVIFNDQLKLTKLAKNSNTIPYEILTGISNRVKRIYFTE